MKKIIFSAAALLLSLTTKSQNTFPSSGNVGIGTEIPTKALDVRGDVNIENILFLKEKLKIGDGEKILTMKYVPGNDTFPDIFKFSPPAGTRPFGVDAGGGVTYEDSQPDLSCLNGSPIPGFVNAFSQMLSVAYNPATSTYPGGQILMGHNGINNIIESKGSGASAPNANDPGDLLINSKCGRNVLFFHNSFQSNGGTMSVGGNVNVASMLQLAGNTPSFAIQSVSGGSNSARMYIRAQAVPSNGIIIRHTHASYVKSAGIKMIEGNNDDRAIAVNRATNGNVGDMNDDGVTNFIIYGNGRTVVGGQTNATNAATLNVNVNGGSAFEIFDQSSNKINFRVKADGSTYARYVKVTTSNFPDYVFDKDYKLPLLKDVESYYKINKHLEGIPTAAEVEKEGLDLGEINTALVKKVEELTIYAVEQNKKAEAMQAQLQELQKQVQELKKGNNKN